ncbi:MAG TPA: NADH-quinone oxidoreductase subunit L [Gemmataceae bacterium]|nr:NADH-quinone oxidoreductase subunit L [Gemmataceae bacterium]
MFDAIPYLWLIPAFPLAASVLTAFLGPRLLRKHSHWPCIVGAVLSCILAFGVLVAIGRQGTEIREYYTWFQAGDVYVGFTLRADALTAIMLVTVTFISSLIAIYSVGYMHAEEGYARFFAEIALFLFSMTGLVLAENLLLLYAFWEGVGLCSYLLIGFWFTKPSAAEAARKAFLVTRLGDIGFLIGILVIWSQFHLNGQPLYALDYKTVFDAVGQAGFEGPITAACLLLFCGAVGKSAQFPLHVWLPDAMEGPTPVSALIHAATMVTAGVYMVARCTPLFERAPDAQLVVGCIGGFTALLAALIALTQNDLKRVLAYSTISQLGYMFLALGSATRPELDRANPLVTMAVVAAIFHLFTHAFFKALLFLAAGSVMHAMGNIIDMRRFGGLRYALPWTRWTFLSGAAALAGFPLLSGFWSKDEILSAVAFAGEEGHPYRAAYVVLLIVGLVTAGLTAFYTFRAYFLTFSGELRTPPEAGHHVHESPPVMVVPLVILAIGALVIGIIVEPFTHWFSGFLALTPYFTPIHEHEFNWLLMVGSSIIALGGIGLAWFLYVFQPGVVTRLASAVPGLYQLSLNKFYLDELYSFFLVQPVLGLAAFGRAFDLYVVDGLVDLLGQVPRFLGLMFRPIQNGLAQFYALAMALGLAVFLIALVWRYGW